MAPPFLTSALDEGKWSALCPSYFNSRGTAPTTHCMGGWVGPRAGLDATQKGKISCPCQESNVDSSVVQPLV
jgi:hypothetical protein